MAGETVVGRAGMEGRREVIGAGGRVGART